jgi:hypothetical protein
MSLVEPQPDQKVHVAPQGFPVFVEVVEALANSAGMASLVRAKLAGARLAPIARVHIRGGHFVGEIDFVRPVIVGDQLVDGAAFQLTRAPEENAGA